ncbi:MAG: RidA family protein [Rhizobiaceae bacterium]
MIERIDTNKRMSQIVKHNGVVYLSGQVGNPGDSAAEQTRQCIAKVESQLEKAGSAPDKILQAIIWLSDLKHFPEMNKVWDSWLPEGVAPTRACGQVQPPREGAIVEITVIAAL